LNFPPELNFSGKPSRNFQGEYFPTIKNRWCHMLTWQARRWHWQYPGGCNWPSGRGDRGQTDITGGYQQRHRQISCCKFTEQILYSSLFTI